MGRFCLLTGYRPWWKVPVKWPKCLHCLQAVKDPNLHTKLFNSLILLTARPSACDCGYLGWSLMWPCSIVRLSVLPSRSVPSDVLLRVDFIKRVRVVAKSAYYPSICPYVSLQLPLYAFPWNFVLRTFMKICQENPIWFKIGQKYVAVYMKT